MSAGHAPGPVHGPSASPRLSPAVPGPGDLGRRVAWRRQELNLSRQQVAELAGMSVTYLEYLERYPGQPTAGALWRLANALQTTPSGLLGGAADLPPGRRARGPQPVLKRLTDAECRGLLAHGGVGRVAFTTTAGPAVVPVNFAMAGGAPVFRTADDTLLAAHADEQVGFEVDHLDEPLAEGWSVLVLGQAHRVTDPGERAWLEDNIAVWPWPGGYRDLYVRIVPERITGRRILAS